MSGTLKTLGTFFYVVDYNSTTFYKKEDIPNYLNEAVPLFLCMVTLEWIIGILKGKNKPRINDAMTSSGHGILYETSKILTQGAELFAYNWLYERRFFDLDWSSPLTWLLAAIGVDFGFYWAHRASHEMKIFWAAHQVHHSSEDFNLTTALRQSIFQRAVNVFLYNPLALLGIPLPAVIVHIQFNLLFQFWIHTELVRKLGPLEWIFNTPSHHRVHHGSNDWCLDKNYAGVLIIWDRMFGTFQAEKEDEQIVYGLIHHPRSLNVLWLQIYYYGIVYRKAVSMETWSDFFKAIFYGPGYFVTAPREPLKSPRPKYDPQLPLWHEIYVVVHYFLALAVQQVLVAKHTTFTWYNVLLYIAFIMVSLGIIGAMYDGWWWAPLVEAFRCVAYVAYAQSTPVIGVPSLDVILVAYFGLSAILWISKSLAVLKVAVKTAKLD